jgi:hypothetical protein
MSREELESIDPNEPRELAGLQTSLRLTQRDLARTAAEQRDEGRRTAREYYESSHSWRVTAPLRRAFAFGRALAGVRSTTNGG